MKRLVQAEEKTVDFYDYQNAVQELYNNIPDKCGIDFYNKSFGREPIQMGINWSAIGTVTPEKAEVFKNNLEKAIELAKNFKYNGYTIIYKR